MNEKIIAHPSKEEREKVLKEIRQLENRQKILENKQRNEERKGTRPLHKSPRLCYDKAEQPVCAIQPAKSRCLYKCLISLKLCSRKG